ncbi:acyl-CoA dehydrogenase [Streptomyces sp. GQFP]|uniref:acyl-CoA dehydrogenase n=1 Tax=Streptomyces sp. GQFP TaxID=2907545 RepID=UPI001F436CF9|nr:acyl-CoA dehydrogenase [Streptomyces sp. GQFP]UIX29300.1 acyl-CoA dehydrogenase [Streptomyces sp. GQFP]
MASLAVHADHRNLAEVARSFLRAQGGTGPAREALDEGSGAPPAYWPQLEKLGWLGLHLPEDVGGQGFGLAETAVVAEEFGRVVAPGPFLSTVIASAVIDRAGSPEQRARWLPALASGAATAAIGLVPGTLSLRDGQVDGETPAVLCAGTTDLLVLAVGADAVVLDHDSPGVTVREGDSLDPTRHAATVVCAAVPVDESAVLRGAYAEAVRVARTLAAAEAAGIADTCTLQVRDHALTREQFGRPIGSFQAVKHQCADMLVAAELAAAAAWGAARPALSAQEGAYAAALAAAQALPAATHCAGRNIQLHGGIGYTWEHDAHLYFKRALALETLFGAKVIDDVVTGAVAGRSVAALPELPEEAASFRAEVRALRAELDALPAGERRAALARSGYLVPHYPRPFGRSAGPVEQLVVEEELRGVEQPDLGVGAWILPTLVQHGTPAQVERWVWPGLTGELRFCQLFSEPEAGSDAAAIRTAARRTEGGWLLNGQKTWTSDAQRCHRGLITVRTDPSAPKHAGVTMMVVDLRAEGVTIRPLRDMTGAAAFNEVFLDDVFVPDADVVGEVDAGWTVARATIGNERVSIGTGQGGTAVDSGVLTNLAVRHGTVDGPLRQRLGEVIAEEAAMTMLNLRHVQATIDGHEGGTDGNIGKLLSAEHAQRATSLALALCGPAALAGAEPEVVGALLYSRGLSIGGGTSEISRNQIAERVLKLPRERK